MSNSGELSDFECDIGYVYKDSVELIVKFYDNDWGEYEYTSIYLTKEDLLNMLKLLEEKECEQS